MWFKKKKQKLHLKKESTWLYVNKGKYASIKKWLSSWCITVEWSPSYIIKWKTKPSAESSIYTTLYYPSICV